MPKAAGRAGAVKRWQTGSGVFRHVTVARLRSSKTLFFFFFTVDVHFPPHGNKDLKIPRRRFLGLKMAGDIIAAKKCLQNRADRVFAARIPPRVDAFHTLDALL